MALAASSFQTDQLWAQERAQTDDDNDEVAHANRPAYLIMVIVIAMLLLLQGAEATGVNEMAVTIAAATAAVARLQDEQA